MPKEWPAQPRFLEVLKTLRSASKVKLDELESLALADARQYYKHAVAILVKQLQVKRPRQRVPILYAINTLATHARDADVGKIYAGRFAPEIVACVAAALKCPPDHVRGVRAVLRRWRRRGTFDPSILPRMRRAPRRVRRRRSRSSRHRRRGKPKNRRGGR